MQQPRPFWDLAMMVRVSGAVMVLGLSLLIAIQNHSGLMDQLETAPEPPSVEAQELVWLLFAFTVFAPVIIYWISTSLIGMMFRRLLKMSTEGIEPPPATRWRIPILPSFFR